MPFNFILILNVRETLMFLHQIFVQGLRRKMENWPTLKLGMFERRMKNLFLNYDNSSAFAQKMNRSNMHSSHDSFVSDCLVAILITLPLL